MSQQETIAQALANAKSRRTSSPADPVLALVESQLKHLQKTLSGKKRYALRLSRINVGSVAETESDPVFARLLSESQEVTNELLRRRFH